MKGNLSDEELKLAGGRLLPKEFAQIRFLARGLGITSDLILKSIFDKTKQQVNLGYFSQGHFREVILVSFAETLFETHRNMRDSERGKLRQLVMESIKDTRGRFVGSTNELTNEILSVLERKQRKLNTMVIVLKRALEGVKKSG